MAQLKDSVVQGSLRVTDTTYTDDLVVSGSKTARYALIAPTSNGAPTWRALTNADVGLGNVENTKLSTWIGTNKITTVGTITSGTWNGTAIAVANGGTGATTAAGARTNLGLGSIATYNAAPAGTKDTWGLVPVIGADGVIEIGKYIDFHTTDGNTKDYDVRITAATTGLTISGTTTGTFSGNLTGDVTGDVSGSSGSCTGNAATATKWAAATTVYVALGTASKTKTIQGGESSAVALGIDGTLAIGHGGTGTSTAPTANGVIYASSTSAYASTAAGTAGYIFVSGGANAAPKWSANAHIIDESGSSVKNKRNELVLGNATGSGSNGSSFGRLALYSENTAGTYLVSASGTAWKTATLQAKDGTIAYTADITAAIQALDGNLNSTTPGAGKTLTAFSQTDGKVSATFGDISIGAGAVSSGTLANARLPARLQEYHTSASNDSTVSGWHYGTTGSPFTKYHTSNTDFMVWTNGYSADWASEIGTDFRSNRLAVRNKNNKTWNSWRELAGSDDIVNELDWTSDIMYDSITNTFTNTRASNNWASQIYSRHGFSTGCYVSFKAVDATHHIMIGLNSDPTTDANWSSIDYAWYLKNDGNIDIRESNTTYASITGHTTYAAGDDFRIEYSNEHIKYFHNGVCCRVVTRAISGKLFLDSSFYNAGSIEDLRFGLLATGYPPLIQRTNFTKGTIPNTSASTWNVLTTVATSGTTSITDGKYRLWQQESEITKAGHHYHYLRCYGMKANSTAQTYIRLGVTYSDGKEIYANAQFATEGAVVSYSSSPFITSVVSTPYSYVRFDTRSGTSGIGTGTVTYTTSAASTWAQIYCQIPVVKNTYATAGDTSSTVTKTYTDFPTKFFFRCYSYNSTTAARIGKYEDFTFPNVNADRTGNATYTIITTKNLSNITSANGLTLAGSAAGSYTATFAGTTASTSTATGAVQMKGGLGVAGQVTALRVGAGGSNTGYTLYVNGNSLHNGIAYFGNGTTYYVNKSGNAKFNTLTAASTLSVTGATTLSGALTVAGATTLNGKFVGSANNYGATLPSSGQTTGQIFFQTSNPVYELPTGGTAGQALVKVNATDRNVTWGGPYVMRSGDTMSGHLSTTYLTVQPQNPSGQEGGEIRLERPNSGKHVVILDNCDNMFRVVNSTNDSNWTVHFYVTLTDGATHMTKGYGAVWNDYAEFRKDNKKETLEAGRCVSEIGDGSLRRTKHRLEYGCEIISDTYGFAIGEDKDNGYNTPIASSGRVLAYPFEDIEIFRAHIGWPVCSGPNGTVSIMTEDEERRYPSRIIGTISEIPSYEEWGTGKVKVNGRIWIRIR